MGALAAKVIAFPHRDAPTLIEPRHVALYNLPASTIAANVGAVIKLATQRDGVLDWSIDGTARRALYQAQLWLNHQAEREAR